MIWLRILSWFVPVTLTFLFRCLVCLIEERLTLKEAEEKGWTYDAGWRCKKCS